MPASRAFRFYWGKVSKSLVNVIPNDKQRAAVGYRVNQSFNLSKLVDVINLRGVNGRNVDRGNIFNRNIGVSDLLGMTSGVVSVNGVSGVDDKAFSVGSNIVVGKVFFVSSFEFLNVALNFPRRLTFDRFAGVYYASKFFM